MTQVIMAALQGMYFLCPVFLTTGACPWSPQIHEHSIPTVASGGLFLGLLSKLTAESGSWQAKEDTQTGDFEESLLRELFTRA